ncbi:MAG: hypothetical protein AB7F19_04965 [Candidatus Babeliales bacterium]
MQSFMSKRFGALILSALLVQATSTLHAEESQGIILTSRVLKFIDGISHAMDGHTILDMKLIIHRLRGIIHGILDQQTKKRVGTFDFQDKKATLHMLARIEERIQATYKAAREELENKYLDSVRFNGKWQAREQALIEQFEAQVQKLEEEMMLRHKGDETRDIAIKQAKRAIMRKQDMLIAEELEALKKEHIENFEQFTKELTELEHKRMQQTQLLAPALAQAKKSFADLTFPFMEQARGSKDFMVPLIEEWAEKAGHKDSMLLRWSEEDPGSEMSMFDHDINNCARLDNMCCNLLDFLTSLIASCPKAVEQYEVLKTKLTHTT